MFDRLVCANLTLTIEDAKKLMGKDIKNHNVTGKLSKSGKYQNLLRNHLQGKVAGFYAHGDDGANDYNSGKDVPQTFSDVFGQPNPHDSVDPFVKQLKYSGVQVPDNLITAFYVNKGVDYYTSNVKFDNEFYIKADQLVENLLDFLT
jgi:hypothetical protein